MKKRIVILFVIAVMLFASACQFAGSKATQDTIVVNKKGNISGVIVEDFDKEYYQSEELSQMIQDEITAYDASSEKVQLKEFEITEENKAYADIYYATGQDYKAFNDTEFFCGTVSAAYDAGYSFVDMQSVNSGESGLDAKSVLEKGAMNVVIFSEPVVLKVPGKIAYVSEGVSVVDKKEVRTEDVGVFYIIYE